MLNKLVRFLKETKPTQVKGESTHRVITPVGAPLERLVPTFQNIRLGRKCLPLTNTPAYLQGAVFTTL